MKTLLITLLTDIVFLSLTTRAQLPEHEVLYHFRAEPHALSTLVKGSDGSFYATASRGEYNRGTVVRVTTNGTKTTLFSFNGTNGSDPRSLMLDADGFFYGTTSTGGASNLGTVFRMAADGAVTTLFSFSGTDGSDPRGALTRGVDGAFYGTAFAGGDFGLGTVFRMTAEGALTTLVSFNGGNGSSPETVLLWATNGYFYGTTGKGGALDLDYGTVFKITTNGALTTLVSFDGSIGWYPAPRLALGPDGNFYGTTSSQSVGTLFRMTPDGALTMLFAFASANGRPPLAGVTLGNDGYFYGTTLDNGNGTVFKVLPDGTATDIAEFGGLTGAYPTVGLTLGDDGDFYGVTTSGGAFSEGTAFRVTPGGVLTRLASLGGYLNGSSPNTLTLAPDGSFYGTCGFGGAWNSGTVFKITPNGTLTTLAPFDGTNGAVPFTSVGPTLGPDGNYYGTTSRGGGGGNVFKMTPDGLLTSLVVFRGTNGSEPYGNLILGGDGEFYGTTTAINDLFGRAPTVFKVSTNGTLTTLASLQGTPWAGLALGPDGNFYGTTIDGGRGNGSVFKVTPTGTLTTLASLAASNGIGPEAGLTLGDDGNFYGTTYRGGSASDAGTVYKVTTNGILTTLVIFRGTNGATPESRLLLGPDGNFYGTTDNGGARGAGTVFMVSTNGVLTTLVSFAYTNGNYPNAGLTLGADGNLYGTTHSGGMANLGTVFRLKTGLQKGPSIVAQPLPQLIFTGSNATFTVSANTTNPPLRYQWLFNGGDLPGATNETLTIPDAQVANIGSYQVVVSDGLRSVRSAEVRLDLMDAIIITSEPADVAVRSGSNATFTVVAYSAEPLHYQWQLNGLEVANATNSILTLSNVQATHLGGYSLILANPHVAVTSRVAVLSFLTPPTITRHPQGVTVVAGGDAVFTMTVTNTATLPVTYRWFKAGLSLTNITLNTTTGSFTLYNVWTNVTTTNGPGSYRVITTNLAGSASSSSATLTVLPAVAPLVTTLPATGITSNGAVLNASVNPMGAQTVAWFEYGLTPAYGGSTAATNVGKVSNVLAFSEAVSGLLPATNYHYRVVATNYGGMALGVDLLFQTSSPAVPPVISAYELLADGRFRLRFDAAPGASFSVFGSTNLNGWADIGPAVEIAPGHFEFVDTEPLGRPTRFYQLKLP